MNKILSDIELYYTEPENISGNSISIRGEDTHHIINVMRHSAGDKLYVTDGIGNIYETIITKISKSEVTADIEQTFKYAKSLSNITFCLPRLKSADRLEFALEKCVELGITDFIIFQSSRTVAKGSKIERWQKITRAAMKQSLRSYLPDVNYLKKFNLLNDLTGEKVLFDQKSKLQLTDYISSVEKHNSKKYYFIFGPEGGLSDNELNSINNSISIKLTDNRLRSETAVVTAAALVSTLQL